MKNILILIILIATISCKKYNLSDNENEILNVYTVGDTLNFKSLKTGKTETYIIMDKTNKLELEGGFSYSKYRFASISYRNIKDYSIYVDQGYSYPEMISIYNGKRSNSLWLKWGMWEEYENNFGTLNSKDTIYFLNKKIIDYYTLNSKDERDSTIKIIWQKSNGIVKYDFRNGDSYVRTNIP